jgi:virginiamycin B lyase
MVGTGVMRAYRSPAFATCMVLFFALMAGCGGGGAAPSPPASSTPDAEATRSPSGVSGGSMAQLRADRVQAVIRVGGAPDAPDWQAEGFGAVWVANSAKEAVQRIDPSTNRVTATVPMGARPCDGLATGFGSVWAVDCARGDLVRIDAGTHQVIARIAVSPASDEGLIATGEGGVWVLSTGNARRGALVRVDPATNRIGARVVVPAGSTAAAVGFGSIWVTTAAGSTVERVDPSTRRVAATIRVHVGPRFLAIGEGAVWVLNQTDGTVSRIDPHTSRVTATIAVNVPGEGGCIAAGEGAVWVTMPGTPVSAIDSHANVVTEQFTGVGGDCISTGFDSVWLSNHELGNVWRLSPR